MNKGVLKTFGCRASEAPPAAVAARRHKPLFRRLGAQSHLRLCAATSQPPIRQRTGRNALKYILLAVILSFTGLQAKASDITANNVIQYSWGYEAGKGFYVQHRIYFYDGDGRDNVVLSAQGWLNGSRAFYFESYDGQGDASTRWYFMTNVSPYYMEVWNEFNDNNYFWSPAGNTKFSMANRTDSYSASYATVRTYIPNDLLNKQLKVGFWLGDTQNMGKDKSKSIDMSGSWGFNIPHIDTSPTITQSLNADGYYDVTVPLWQASDLRDQTKNDREIKLKMFDNNGIQISSRDIIDGNVTIVDIEANSSFAFTENISALQLGENNKNVSFQVYRHQNKSGYTYTYPLDGTKQSISLPGCLMPKTFTAAANNGRIKLDWTIDAGTSASPNFPYTIQSKKITEDDNAWKDVTVLEGDLNYDHSATSKTVYVQFPAYNETDIDYVFRIIRKNGNGSWTSSAKKANCTVPATPLPRNVYVTADPATATITVGWDITPQTNADAIKANYNLVWSIPGTETVIDTDAALTSGTTFAYAGSELYHSVTIPYPLLEQGTKTLYFAVSRVNIGWGDRLLELPLNTNVRKFTGITGASDTSGIKIFWTQDDGCLPKEWYYRLYRKDVNASAFDYNNGCVKEVKTGSLDRPEMLDNILSQTCTPYHYQVRLEDGETRELAVVKATSPIMNNESVIKIGSTQGEITAINASKGYFNDRVQIKWKVTADNSFSRYTLSRRQYGNSNEVPEIIQTLSGFSAQTTDFSYTDNTAIPGVYYIYEAIGWIDCNNTSNEGSSLNDIGFVQPFGVVSGKVTYEGGNAVQGVSVVAENDKSSQYANRVAEFNASNNVYVDIPYKANMLNPDAFTFQAWVKTNPTNSQIIFDAPKNYYGVEMIDKRISLVCYDGTNKYAQYAFNQTFETGEYYHISITYRYTGGAYEIKLYINGKLKETQTVAPSYNNDDEYGGQTYIGRSWKNANRMFNGFIDEFRLWKTALDSVAIANNYDTYLSGKEENLALYYRFDDPINDKVFDISGRNGVFNENHGTVYGSPVPERTTNNASPCYNKAVTDANGNYLINTIPYTGEGSTVTLKPMMGVHRFNPSDKPMFFNQQSATYNNVDFIDISAFKVTGNVYYENSNYPVAGAMLKIDGNVVAREGKVVLTNEEGYYEIQVPIGEHSVSVELQGHTFANGGRFPANVLEKHNFQNPMNGISFFDQTTIRIKGRVAGGKPQTDKPIGFGLSKANIGQATVTLETVNDTYKLNLSDADSIVDNNIIGGVTSKTTFKSPASGSIVEIETNPETGEFLAVLPPVPFHIAGIKTKDFEDTFVDGDVRDFECSKMTFDANPFIADTAKYTDPVTGTTTVFVSNDSVKITKYTDPEFLVTDNNNENGAFGDSIYVYTNPTTGVRDTVRLYTVSGGTVTYTLGAPVLSQNTYRYSWNVKVYEEYINKDGDDEWVSDIVPLEGSQINISNALAAERIILDSITYNEISREESSSLMLLDSAGARDYSFIVSFPNMSGNNQLNAKLTLSSNGKDYVWEKSAILLGQMPSDGSNFVTRGPDHVDVVLHDPPGSNSYAYIEKGSSYTHKYARTDVSTVSEAVNLTAHFGSDIETGNGLGVVVMSEIKSIVDVAVNTEFEEVFTGNNERETTITFNQQISTSGDPNYIGSMADVYIGRSTNLIFGMMNQLALYPNDQIPEGVTPSTGTGNFSLFPKRVLTAEQEFATAFTYTQAHVLETQIPNIKELRNQLLETVPNPEVGTGLYFGDKAVKYLTSLPANDPNFGEPETYHVYYASTLDGLKAKMEERDEIWEYNTWIINWEKRIRDNEETQIKLFEKRAEYENNKAGNASDIWNNKKIFENVSYDAGVALEKSLEVSYSDLKINGKSFTAGSSLGATTTIGIKAIAVAVLEANLVVGGKREQGNETTSGAGNSMKFGYALAEDESVLFAGQDALSVDVYGPMWEDMKKGFELDEIYSLSGYIFQRRAGQTSCPYEEADSTLFYKVNGEPVLKNYGTFKIEKAQLYVDNKTSASVENIPSGREGTFTLQMQNLSEAKMDVTYRLSVDATTNPNGLILELDGAPLTDVRQFRVRYGEEITKVLKVRQSSVDILEYENIAIHFGSVCDIEDYSEAYISAKFIPSSSPVKLVSNSRLANVEGLNNGGKIRFTISDYDRSYKNFGCIRLEYRSAVNENWTTLRTYVNDEDLYPVDSEDKEAITGPSHSYDFSYSAINPSDGEYIFRAVSVSKVGTQEITCESEEIRVVKDVRAPQELGYPSPVNGILNAGDEISVTFNEDIQSGKLVNSLVGGNFKITGILNGDTREEPTSGVAFSGSQSAYTELPIYTNGSFSIETWFKRTNNTAGTLFAYGSEEGDISLGFDATGHAVVAIGDESYTSTDAINNADDTWKYIGLAYNRSENTVSVFEFEGSTNKQLFLSKQFTKVPATHGKLYVGSTVSGTNGFQGAAGLLHFYDAVRSEGEMGVAKSLTKSGTEPNLIGLWEMEECEGVLAKDKARARHLSLNNASWYIYPQGKTVALNGIDQSVAIPSGTFTFPAYDDFTWEFWFLGDTQGEATLFSCGAEYFVGFNAGHQLTLTVGANTQVLTTANLLDNKWHHFALSVKRNGMTKALIDGTVTSTFSSNIFNGSVGGAYYYLGTRYYGAVASPQFGAYFAGNVDELRVWNLAHTTESLVLNKNSKLRGNEAGLLAYYPFEQNVHVNGSAWNVNATLNDMLAGSANIAVSTGAFSDNSTPMKNSRPVNDIPFTFTASERTIVLNITEEPSLIEGVTLNISIENVLDMHDNKSQPVSWIAFVNRNPLNWLTDKVDIVMEKTETKTFKASITNNGGRSADYYIEDLPAWLTVNAPSGTLPALGTKELTFSIAPGINSGGYEASVLLRGVNDVRKVLPVTLKVTGERPDWAVNPANYEFSMSVLGQIKVEGYIQEDEDDILAAFIGNECVGVTSPVYVKDNNAYYVFVSIYGNTPHFSQPVTFKLWDASTGEIYPSVKLSHEDKSINVNFSRYGIVGSISKPVIFNAENVIEQTYPLLNGWTWISVNMTNTDPTIFNQMKTSLSGGVGLSIRGSNNFSDAPNWLGSLNSISEKNMYMVSTSQAHAMILTGRYANPETTEITLKPGWNWIGYIPSFSTSLKNALAGIATAQAGDLIKSQAGFSAYIGNGNWAGTLTSMQPGIGYMYNSANTTSSTFTYPSVALRSLERRSDADEQAHKWATDYTRFPTSMTITAIVLDNDVPLESDRVEVAAFSGDECRGSAMLQYVEGLTQPYLGFLMVHGEDGDEITYRVFDHATQTEYTATGPADRFHSDGIYGNPLQPVALKTSGTTGNLNPENGLSFYPNPVKTRLYIRRDALQLERVEVIDLSGRLILLEENFIDESLDVSRLESGVYVLKIVKNGQLTVHKFIKQ